MTPPTRSVLRPIGPQTLRARGVVGALGLAAALLWPGGAAAKVFATRQQALAQAFPSADRIESRTHVLTDAQVERIQQLSHSPLDSKLIEIHSGWQGERLLGHAIIDLHRVRTLPEALMLVLTPEGRVASILVLAFHEPLDYMPGGRWYAQFEGKGLDEPLRLGDDIHAVIGATLSSRATVSAVQRALAFHQVLLQPAAGPPGPAAGSEPAQSPAASAPHE